MSALSPDVIDVLSALSQSDVGHVAPAWHSTGAIDLAHFGIGAGASVAAVFVGVGLSIFSRRACLGWSLIGVFLAGGFFWLGKEVFGDLVGGGTLADTGKDMALAIAGYALVPFAGWLLAKGGAV
ncbi:MAG: hypothetical protein N4A61_04770 [Pelagimonas sp.]|jgi:hypothetical protein|nr:hypothetical protein [Pelagimonas sp.]